MTSTQGERLQATQRRTWKPSEVLRQIIPYWDDARVKQVLSISNFSTWTHADTVSCAGDAMLTCCVEWWPPALRGQATSHVK